MTEDRPCCGHCGGDTRTYVAGWATVGMIPVCHPNEPSRPDCYRLVTVYRHPLFAPGGRCPCDGTLAELPEHLRGVEPGQLPMPRWHLRIPGSATRPAQPGMHPTTTVFLPSKDVTSQESAP